MLLALIDVDGGVYAIDTATLKSLEGSRRQRAGDRRAGAQRPRAAPPDPLPAPVVEDTSQQTPPPPSSSSSIVRSSSIASRSSAGDGSGLCRRVYRSRGRSHVATGLVPASSRATFVPFQSGSAATVRPAPRTEPRSRSTGVSAASCGPMPGTAPARRKPRTTASNEDRDRGDRSPRRRSKRGLCSASRGPVFLDLLLHLAPDLQRRRQQCGRANQQIARAHVLRLRLSAGPDRS